MPPTKAVRCVPLASEQAQSSSGLQSKIRYQRHLPARYNACSSASFSSLLFLVGRIVQDFFDFCSEMLCVADQRGYFTRLNPAWTDILGWSIEELTAHPYIEFVHPDDVAATLHEASLLQSDHHQTVHFRNRYRCKDGSYKWLSWKARTDSTSGAVLATARDVTIEQRHLDALQQSEARLRASEHRLRTLFDQAPVGIASVDSHSGRFLEMNPKYAEILGRTQEEALEFDFQTVTHPDDLQEDLDNMQALLQGEIKQFRMEKRYIRPDGSLRWVDLIVVPIWQDGETPKQHLAIVEDISQRKRAEERLQTKEAQLTGLLENSSNVMYLKDKAGRYLLTNRCFRELFGRSEEEIIGKTDLDLFAEENAATFQTSDGKVWEDQTAHVFEEIVVHEDARHTYRSVKFPVKDRRGKMLAVGGISTDITDITKAYQKLEEKERLLRNLIQVQEQEKQFVCYEFHDGLVQHATGSKMILESLLRRGDLDETCTNKIELVVRSLEQGIADGRRVIQGIRPTVLDDFGIDAAIQDIIQLIPPSELAVELDIEPGLGRLPRSLEATVYRVVQEAINNAHKHSGSDRVAISLRHSAENLEINIRDYGCGFDVEQARRSGFGLLGMTERVRLAGGECRIESTKDRGTTIAIQLPIEDEDA